MASERAAFYSELSSNWRMQMGSLGSGNHFIEVVLDDDDNVWAFLHSGSRRVGNRIAQYHINVARRLMKKLHISLEDPDLAYLPGGHPGVRCIHKGPQLGPGVCSVQQARNA